MILRRVVEEAKRLLGTDGAHLTRMSESGTFLVPVVVAGAGEGVDQSWLLRMEFPLGGGINGLAAEHGAPDWTRDYLADDRIPHEGNDDEVAERLGLRGMAAAPLRAPGGEVIGTLAVSAARPRDFADRGARSPPGPGRPGGHRDHQLDPAQPPDRVRGAVPLSRRTRARSRLVDRRGRPADLPVGRRRPPDRAPT